MLSATMYGRVKELFEQTFGSSMIYLCSNAADLKSEDLRPYIDRYIRGSNGKTAEERIQLMKLAWDAFGSEFGGRHELYERNYAGNWEDVKLQRLMGMNASGETTELKALVDRCLSEYDVDGWKMPGFVDPTDVSVVGRKF
jgi:4-hydroxyphenylacetate 3-monooxygenase